MTVKRFSGTFKARTDILDNITPNNVVQPNVSVPAGEWKPAAWLPVVWQGEASKDFFVISSGKIVCLDRTGRIVPARYKWLAANAAGASGGDDVIQYTADDVEALTEDVTTGLPVTAARTVTLLQLATAIISRGWVSEHEVATALTGVDATNPLDGRANAAETLLADSLAILDLFVSAPIGVCAYDVFSWAGDAPGELKMVNYQKQHLVQFFTDIQLKVPVHVLHANAGVEANVANAVEVQTAPVASRSNFAADNDDGVGQTFPVAGKCQNNACDGGLRLSSTQLALLVRYSADIADGDDIVGVALPDAPIASNTDRTPIADGNTALVREVKSISRLRAAGDFFVDPDVGIILAFDPEGGGAIGHAANVFSANITFHTYEDSDPGALEASSAAAERYVHFSKVPRPGAYVTFDSQSNFAPIVPAADGSTLQSLIVGRCLGTIREPRGLLDRVRTAWEGSSFGVDAQMPGSATKGFSDLISLSPEGTSDLVALINIKVQ